MRDNYTFPSASDDELDWVVRARDEEVVEKAEKVLRDAVERAKKADKVGLLTGLPRSAFPRIIGSK